jgi:hypothetical protein
MRKLKPSLLPIALVPVIFVIEMMSFAATTLVQAYPTDRLFAQQINQTVGAIIDFRPPADVQKYLT